MQKKNPPAATAAFLLQKYTGHSTRAAIAIQQTKVVRRVLGLLLICGSRVLLEAFHGVFKAGYSCSLQQQL